MGSEWSRTVTVQSQFIRLTKTNLKKNARKSTRRCASKDMKGYLSFAFILVATLLCHI